MKFYYSLAKRLIIFFFLFQISPLTMADIPYEVKFNAVFNYEKNPVTGNQTVTVRLLSDTDEIIYKEVVRNVPFHNGVSEIVIGGKDSLLVNSIFDDPNLKVSISVKQHNLTFPINSTPYTIRSKEANKARRVDNESIVKFLETERRVGVNTLTPEVSLDINGVLRVQDILPSDELSNGVFYWDGNKNMFLVYRNGVWNSMSWIPEPQDRSKWALYNSPITIESTKNVGVGLSPNSYALAVTKNMKITSQGTVGGNLDIFGSVLLPDGKGFSTAANLYSPAILFNTSANSWSQGNLTFSGVLTGNGSGLTQLNHFGDKTFETKHFADALVLTENVINQSIQSHHIIANSVQLSHLKQNQVTGNWIEDYSLTSVQIASAAIQTHHMRKSQISSEDIKLNQFVKSKFKDDSIQTNHIVDGQITGIKILTANVLSQHLVTQSITTQKIKDRVLEGRHVPLNSIPISNYNDVFTIARGGTSKTSFLNYGILYSDASGQYNTNDNILMLKDGLLGVGGVPDSTSLLTLNSTQNARLGISADDEKQPKLIVQNSIASWNFYVDTLGDFRIDKGQDVVLKMTSQGNLGVGNAAPSEVLSLNGPMVLGPAVGVGEPGSIRYQDGQFSIFKSSWVPITSAAISKREFKSDQLDQLIASSVLFSSESDLIGQQMMVQSVQDTKVWGNTLVLSDVLSSKLFGQFSFFQSINQSQLNSLFSTSQFILNTVSDSENSTMAYIHDSQLNLEGSNVSHLVDSDANMVDSTVLFSTSANLEFIKSDLGFSNHVSVNASNASIVQVNHLVGEIKDSRVQFSSKVNAELVQSELSFLDDVDVRANGSSISHAQNSVFDGQGQCVLGGKGHLIRGDQHISLRGDAHHIDANRSVAIGDHIQIDHDDVVLINSSAYPLSSSHPGEVRIQADGGVKIRFSDDSLALMSGDDGWGHISDESMKMGKQPVDSIQIMNKFRELPIQYWVYKNQEHVKHLGPMAQDFYRIFNYGNSDRIIHGIDADGVLLATIKGVFSNLNQIHQLLDSNSLALIKNQQKITDYSDQLAKMSKKVSVLDQKYQQHQYLLKQFNEDNQTQSVMIDYIKSALFKLNLQHKLHQLKTKLIVFFFVGVLCGLIGFKIKQRIQERKS
ncbi:MAG: tail fiber domain-containing protein [Candidatus Margulisiibacteriota bacterium]